MLTPRIRAATGNLTSNAQITIGPFQNSLGKTIGFALRRTLLSSIPGVAVTQLNIDGVVHQLSSVYGLVEDASQVIANIRQVIFQTGEDSLTANLTKDTAGTIYAHDIRVTKPCRIINPNLVIGHLNTGRFNLSMRVQKGWGYVPKDNKSQSSNVITLDAAFSPVKNVTYSVREIEVEGNTNAEELTLGIQTNSSVSPVEALKQSVGILKTQLTFMESIGDETQGVA